MIRGYSARRWPSTPIALVRRTTRAVALALLIQVVTVFRPGYLPNMYVIGMLPFAALIVPGSIEALWRWARLLRFPVVLRAMRAVLAAVTCVLVFAAAPRWDERRSRGDDGQAGRS